MKQICEMTGINLPNINGILNLPDGDCPVDWSLKVADSASLASCGKGTMCRDGMIQIRQIIKDITLDKGRNDDLDLLKELCEIIILANECELSKDAATLIQASLSNHSSEWLGHLTKKKCSSLVCGAFYTVHVSPEKCSGCNKCVAICPVGAIAGDKGLIHLVDNNLCTRCGICFNECPDDAFIKAGTIKPKCPEEPIPVGSFAEAPKRRRRPGNR